MGFETLGFKFLSLLFGKNFKERDLKSLGFKFPPIVKGLEPPFIRVLDFHTWRLRIRRNKIINID